MPFANSFTETTTTIKEYMRKVSKYCSVVGTIAPMPGEPHAMDMITLYVEGQSTPI